VIEDRPGPDVIVVDENDQEPDVIPARFLRGVLRRPNIEREIVPGAGPARHPDER
jgi:hypothetical protein